MAIITSDGRVGNCEKKTRQGRGKNTKFGTKPQTHLGSVPKKTLSKYKKRSGTETFVNHQNQKITIPRLKVSVGGVVMLY